MTPLDGLWEATLYALAFNGLWHILGLPPLIEIWRSLRPRRRLPGRLKIKLGYWVEIPGAPFSTTEMTETLSDSSVPPRLVPASLKQSHTGQRPTGSKRQSSTG